MEVKAEGIRGERSRNWARASAGADLGNAGGSQPLMYRFYIIGPAAFLLMICAYLPNDANRYCRDASVERGLQNKAVRAGGGVL